MEKLIYKTTLELLKHYINEPSLDYNEFISNLSVPPDKIELFKQILVFLERKKIIKVIDNKVEILREPDYRSVSFNKFIDFINQKDWEGIFVKEVRIYKGSNNYYEFIIGENTIITLEQTEILTPKIFREKYFAKFKCLLPIISNNEWCNFINQWMGDSIEMSESSEMISFEQEAMDALIEYIEGANIILKIEYSLRFGYIYIKDNEILIPNRALTEILNKNKINLSKRKITYVLKDYLSRPSTPYKINNKSIRFWIFKKDRFEIDENKIIQEEDE